jgi:hypothetical protein
MITKSISRFRPVKKLKYIIQSKLIYVCQLYLHVKTLEFNNKHV